MSDEDWEEARLYVMSTLDGINEELKAGRIERQEIKTEVVTLKTVSRMWGGLAGGLIGSLVAGGVALLKAVFP